MGWGFQRYPTRLSVVQARTTGTEELLAGGVVVSSRCLASCYRGGPAFGVLWSVWERTLVREGQPCGKPRRWIICDMLKVTRQRGWGFQSFVEATDPRHFSCPLSYLDMVPIADFGGNAHWRARVTSGHALRAATRGSLRTARMPSIFATGPGRGDSFANSN